jgi:[acyl-carrier-protein] S-malonyltransferase
MMLQTAVVFPGQGSQSVGMLYDLSQHHPIIIELFSSVSDHLGYDVWKLVQEGPESLLNQTEQTQVAMLVSDVAVYKVIEQNSNIRPLMMAGHSLGEYAALVAAGAIGLLDAAALVATRGRLMQEAIPLGVGAMAAVVGLSNDDIDRVCRKASTMTEQVTPANYNAIGQVVIAGHTSAVERAIALARDTMDARMAILLPVSVPCHCPLLKDAAEIFDDVLQSTTFHVPSLPVLSNVDVSIYESASHIRRLLKTQLYSPVRWVDIIQSMKTAGIERVVECGPGRVLSGLIKRIDKSLDVGSVNDEASLNAVLLKMSSIA